MALSLHKELNQVLFEENCGVRKVILNRPKKLNSLNYEMISKMLKKLELYETDPKVKLVILKGNGRAFCAGGDVSAAINFITAGHWSFGARFYNKQYALDYLLATYNKPLVSLLNGVVMGGGAGISMHARFRIVTENTVFAMPEAAIGLFPDVGASYFLSRCPGYFGEYLGLTGARLDGTEMIACGLATHFVYSKDLASLENALVVAASLDILNPLSICKIVAEFEQKTKTKLNSPYMRLEIINQCFSKETVEEILSSLEYLAANNQQEKWITEALNFVKSASPTSLKLFLRTIREGRKRKLEECFAQEFNILCHIMRRTFHDDFFEGSRAMLIEKDKKPQWEPSKLELVSEEMVDKFFKDADDDDEWKALQLPSARSISAAIVQYSKL